MSNTHLDAKFNGEAFRKDHPIILATNRHLATLLPVRMAFEAASGYKAGKVISLNSVDGLYYSYDPIGASGLDVAHAILFEDVEPLTGDTMLARGIFGGEVFEDKLTNLDSDAKTDLGGRSITDAIGPTIFKF